VPVFAGEPIPLPVPALAPALFRLCDALAEGGAGDAATHIREAIASGNIERAHAERFAPPRFRARCGRERSTAALADLMWLVGELAVSPFVHALQVSCSDTSAPRTAAALDAGISGTVRRAAPGPGRRGRRRPSHAARSFCSSGWELTTYACIYCAESGDRSSPPRRTRSGRIGASRCVRRAAAT